MSKIELDLELLGGWLGQTPQELENDLFEGEGEEKKLKSDTPNVLKSKFSKRLKSIQKEYKDEGYGQAKREVLTSKEKELSKKFKVDGSSLEEMFQNVIKKAEEGKESKAVTFEQFKNSEHYEPTLKPFIEKATKFEKDLMEERAKVQRYEKKSKTQEHFSTLWNEYQIPTDGRGKNYKKSAENELLSYDYDFEKGHVLKDNKIVKDDNLNPIPIESFFHQTTSNWLEKKTPEKKQTPGGQSGYKPPATSPNSSTVKFESKEAYFKARRDELNFDKKKEIDAAWKLQNAAE